MYFRAIFLLVLTLQCVILFTQSQSDYDIFYDHYAGFAFTNMYLQLTPQLAKPVDGTFRDLNGKIRGELSFHLEDYKSYHFQTVSVTVLVFPDVQIEVWDIFYLISTVYIIYSVL